MLGLFAYRTFSVPLEFHGLGPEFDLRVSCPLCGKRCRVPGTHTVVVDHGQRKVLRIHPVIGCPSCQWRVVVSEGVAFDVAAPAAPGSGIMTSHSERVRKCAACGETFSSKTLDRCQKCRDATERPIAAHQRFKLK